MTQVNFSTPRYYQSLKNEFSSNYEGMFEYIEKVAERLEVIEKGMLTGDLLDKVHEEVHKTYTQEEQRKLALCPGLAEDILITCWERGDELAFARGYDEESICLMRDAAKNNEKKLEKDEKKKIKKVAGKSGIMDRIKDLFTRQKS